MKKILVTLGPQSLREEIIKEIDKHDIYLYRINLSHTDLNSVEDTIRLIKAASKVPICLDSEGAQIRCQKIKDGSVLLVKGGIIKLWHDEVLGDAENISFTPVGVAKEFAIGDIISIDFDMAAIKIIEKNARYTLAEVLQSGRVSSDKAADIDRDIYLAPITVKDRHAFEIGKKMGIRNFALSFANSADDVRQLKKLVGGDSKIISKIESRSGVANLKTILNVTDEILIDRGDLSRQIPIQKIPFLQRRIISIAKVCDVPVYVATNLLESMVNNRNPTRAEVNDVVSTILSGADGLVLAAETAIGKHPVSTTKMIRELVTLCKKWTPNTNIEEILEM